MSFDAQLREEYRKVYAQGIKRAVECYDSIVALELLDSLVSIALAAGTASTEEEARAQAKEEIAYHAGYYGHAVRLRVEELFGCQHPIFGAAKNWKPTPEEAFALGSQVAEGMGLTAIRERRDENEKSEYSDGCQCPSGHPPCDWCVTWSSRLETHGMAKHVCDEECRLIYSLFK